MSARGLAADDRNVQAARLRTLPAASALGLALAAGLVFFYAPEDADQGLLQKIFYLHVPMAIVALCGFIAGGVFAVQHLRTRDPHSAGW